MELSALCQKTLAEEDLEKYRKATRRERFLEEMVRLIPWAKFSAAIEPSRPNPKRAGRRPIGIKQMLRIHFLRHWFDLSAPAVEEALYDSRAMRRYAGIDLGGSRCLMRSPSASFAACARPTTWGLGCSS